MKQLIAVVILFTLVSCGNNSGTHSNLINASVVNGKLVKETDAIKSSVVALFNTKSNYICTGTLIASNIVLTAAHCMPNKAQDMKVIFGLDVDETMNTLEPDVKAQNILQVTDFKAHQNFAGENDTREINRDDIAVIKFKGEIPSGYKPATMLADEKVIKLGTVVTVAGFGVNLVDMEQIDPKKYKNLKRDLESGEVFCDGNMLNCFKIEMSGDGILRQGEAPINFVHEMEVFLNESKSGTCSGDSGGPAFINQNGQYFLFGVTSRGSEMCNELGAYTNALKYKKWIADTSALLK